MIIAWEMKPPQPPPNLKCREYSPVCMKSAYALVLAPCETPLMYHSACARPAYHITQFINIHPEIDGFGLHYHHAPGSQVF